MLVEAVPQPYNMICAFADDIGIVARAIFKVLPIILKLFTNLFLSIRLQLNFRKTAVIPLWDNGVSDIRFGAADRAPQLLECNFASCATYLGIVVGPGAEANRWTKASAKFWARAVLARYGGNGFFSSVRRYRTYSFSVLSYIAQLTNPSNAMLTLEAKALQHRTAGPWNAMPAESLQNLKRLGFSLELPSLRELARAAMYRVAITSPAFWSACNKIDSGSDDLDSRIVRKDLLWHSSSCIKQLIDNKRSIEDIGMQQPLDNPWLILSKLLRLIHGARPDSTVVFTDSV